MALSEAQIEELRRAAHEAPLAKIYTDHKGNKSIGVHTDAWAKAGREWCEASRAALGAGDE